VRKDLFRFDIITKAGLLVFSHDFIKGGSNGDEDHDLQAGLTSAAISALRETQGETITEIKQVDYTLFTYEGILTYGLLTVQRDTGLRLRDFLRKIVLKFELMFSELLHSETLVKKGEYEIFRNQVISIYNEYSLIDVDALNRVLEIIAQSDATNFIIYNVTNLQPIFTSILDHSIKGHLSKLSRIIGGIEELCMVKEEPSEDENQAMTIELNLPNVVVNAIRTEIHWIVSLTDPTQINKNLLSYETNLIKNILTNISSPIENHTNEASS
jgi:hypothetical protein